MQDEKVKYRSGFTLLPMDELVFYFGLTPDLIRGRWFRDCEGQEYTEFSSYYKRVTQSSAGRRIVEFSPFPFDSISAEELIKHKSFTLHGYLGRLNG